LNKIIEKYGNDQNRGKDPASKDPYEWRMGGNGEDSDGDGKKEYDCSHFLNQVLKEIGYNNPYQSTGALKNSSYYDEVDKADLQKGDIVLFNGHVGFFYGYDEKGNMLVYSSSGSNDPKKPHSTGPTITLAKYFPGTPKFLRPKPTTTPSLPIGNIKKKVNTASVTTSPIMLDLDGDGVIKTLGTEAGIHFDHDANGFAEQTGWVSPDDGLLVMDRNNDGIINNGRELFGDNTILKNGSLATDGLQALADLDDNKDGKININDSSFNQLRIWKDVDGDFMKLAA
jgi:hypothetical protein